MSNPLNSHKTGLALGGLLAAWHLAWSVCVALGLAEPLFKSIMRLHFMDMPVTFAPFSFMTAVYLIIVTFVVGYVVGWVFSKIWNYVHKG